MTTNVKTTTAKLRIKKNRPNYLAIIRYRDETGKERQKWETSNISVKGNNKRKTEAWKDEVLAEFLNEKVGMGLDIGHDEYFVDFIKTWLETLRITKKIQVATHGSYTMTLNQHILPYFAPFRLKVNEVEPKHIQAYVNYKMQTLSPNTLKKHMANISACLKSAVRQSIIPCNPADRIEEIRKVKCTGAKFMSEGEIERMLDCFKDDPLETAVLLALFYGLRRSEALGLLWKSVDFDKRASPITKQFYEGGKAPIIAKRHTINIMRLFSSNPEFKPILSACTKNYTQDNIALQTSS